MSWADETIALANLEARVRTVQKACGADAVIIALSCPTRRYWRHELMGDSYKGHRVGGQKPICLSPLREHLEKNYNTYVRPRLEADDILGILATHPTLVAGEKVIVTSDKDLNQIPGLHLNHSKLEKGITTIQSGQGDRFHLFQTLVGDRTDGYPGCPGIGPVKAEKILNGSAEEWLTVSGVSLELHQWRAVVSAFVRAGKTEADALMQARVARILRHTDWDFEKKEPILWQPK